MLNIEVTGLLFSLGKCFLLVFVRKETRPFFLNKDRTIEFNKVFVIMLFYFLCQEHKYMYNATANTHNTHNMEVEI